MPAPPAPQPDLEVVDAPTASLKPNTDNPRTITKTRFEALVHSLRSDPDMMRARPVVALTDGTVIMGNMRLRAAQQLGWETIPTVFVDLDEMRAREWLLRDNQEYGEWHEDQLAEMLFTLAEAQRDLSLTGFDEDSIRRLLASVAPGGNDPPGVTDDRADSLELVDVTIGDPEHEVAHGQVWLLRVEAHAHTLVVADVFTEHALWRKYLRDGVVFVPYPTPTLTLTRRADRDPLLLVQPDRWCAGHLLDKFASVRGVEQISGPVPA